MRLQSDPTIIYGLVGGKGALDHPIQQEELDRETAYNTYKINGLPPTPIANPGRAAIEAVLRPAKTKDLYFVADGTGGHVFAPTLDEHNKNVVTWRKIEREIRAREAGGRGQSGRGGQPPATAADGGALTGAPLRGRRRAASLQPRTSRHRGPTRRSRPDVFVDPESPGLAVSLCRTARPTGAEPVPSPQRNPNR